MTFAPHLARATQVSRPIPRNRAKSPVNFYLKIECYTFSSPCHEHSLPTEVVCSHFTILPVVVNAYKPLGGRCDTPYLTMSTTEGGWKPRGGRFLPRDWPKSAAGGREGGAGQSSSDGGPPPAKKRKKKVQQQKMEVVGE